MFRLRHQAFTARREERRVLLDRCVQIGLTRAVADLLELRNRTAAQKPRRGPARSRYLRSEQALSTGRITPVIHAA